MKRRTKIFFGILGGATLGMLLLSFLASTLFRVNFLALNSLLMSYIGAVLGGVIGYFVGKNV